ncbi:MAG: tetratricopeptide repeat protein [Candidatus Obscuribacterales bacterium]|nr:tetratricopeptide repeat protein [Candidatus Obscuribacterales bacterium]
MKADANADFAKMESIWRGELQNCPLDPWHEGYFLIAEERLAEVLWAKASYYETATSPEIETLYRDALRRGEKYAWLGDGEHNDIVKLRLASYYESQRRYGEAECLIKSVFVKLPQHYAEYGLNLSNVVFPLVDIYEAQGRYQDAELLLDDVLRDHQQTGRTSAIPEVMERLGILSCAQHKEKQAISWWQQGVSIARKGTTRDDYVWTIRLMSRLGVIYQKAGLETSAEQELKDCLAVIKKYRPKNEIGSRLPCWPATGPIMTNLGESYIAKKEYSLAEPLCKEAIAECELSLDKSRCVTDTEERLLEFHESAQVLSRLYLLRGDKTASEELLNQVQKISDQYPVRAPKSKSHTERARSISSDTDLPTLPKS